MQLLVIMCSIVNYVKIMLVLTIILRNENKVFHDIMLVSKS